MWSAIIALFGAEFAKWAFASLTTISLAAYAKSYFPNVSLFPLILIALLILEIILAIWFVSYLHSLLYGPNKGLLT